MKFKLFGIIWDLLPVVIFGWFCLMFVFTIGVLYSTNLMAWVAYLFLIAIHIAGWGHFEKYLINRWFDNIYDKPDNRQVESDQFGEWAEVKEVELEDGSLLRIYEATKIDKYT